MSNTFELIQPNKTAQICRDRVIIFNDKGVVTWIFRKSFIKNRVEILGEDLFYEKFGFKAPEELICAT